MAIVINLDLMPAKRKVKSRELAASTTTLMQQFK